MQLFGGDSRNLDTSPRFARMKVSFPLSLKVTVWLLFNLLLLGAAAIAFLVAQGGLSWDSLVTGAPGDRLHALSNVVVGEVAAAPRASRDAVLARFSKAYGADFVLIRNHGPQLAGTPMELPVAVRARIDEGPPLPRAFDRGNADGPPEMGPGPGEPNDGPGRPPDEARRPLNNARGRFLVRTSNPSSWWIGFRVPYAEVPNRPLPATVLIRAQSLRSVMLLLNLEAWLLVGASVLALSILFWLPLVRSITSHLRALTAATEKIAEGKFETRVATNRRDELGRLGESVNAMAGRLDTLVNGQKRFLADIAHELGSPLGRLQVATEILETRAKDGLREQVADVREEVQHMADLVNELLAFTKAGMRARDATLSSVSVDATLEKAVTREDTTARVRYPKATQLTVLADEPLLTRAVGNLVRNALRYAGDNAVITVNAKHTNGHVTLVVEDDGPGVPAAALERLGEPFYRPELARTRETGGVGLGLAIVRSGVAACGGTVHFSNRTPRGFRAEIKLTAA